MIDLTQYPELIVKQEIEFMEVFMGLETQNKYSIPGSYQRILADAIHPTISLLWPRYVATMRNVSFVHVLRRFYEAVRYQLRWLR